MTSTDLTPNPQPLSGKRILITRAHEQAGAMARELERLGATVVSIPTIEIRPPQSFQPLDKALQKIPAYDWLLLTSVNGVKALFKRMEKQEMHSGMLRQLSVVAIGPATRAELEQHGVKVAITPEEYVAESVVSALKDKVAGKRVLLVRAKVARDVIPQELRRLGAEVDVAEAYETVVPQNSREKIRAALADPEQRPNIITFTSSSTVKNFITLLGANVSPKEQLQGIAVASIGPVTSATLIEVGLGVNIEAKDYTIPGLIDAIVRNSQPLPSAQ
ncbi:MAG: uroporphyrinogen-III synthase [Acidobacteriaceae bacterium]|nr:uroporphyrinogen-III synthase [Acidobacteriaceae bacterium]